MYIHFKSLNTTNVCSQICYSDGNLNNNELNKAFTENEVIECIKGNEEEKIRWSR